MPNTEKIVDAVIAELKTTDNRTPQAWASLRRRFARVVDIQLAPAAAVPTERLYTTHEVAQLLQVDATTVAKWIDTGKIIAFRTPGKHRRIRKSDFERFCEQFQIPITGVLTTP